MLDIILEEEPGFLPPQGFGYRIRISHGCNTNFSIRDTANEFLYGEEPCVVAFQWSSSVVGGDTRDEMPIPGSGYIFIFVPTEESILDAICKVKSEWLSKRLQLISTFIHCMGNAHWQNLCILCLLYEMTKALGSTHNCGRGVPIMSSNSKGYVNGEEVSIPCSHLHRTSYCPQDFQRSHCCLFQTGCSQTSSKPCCSKGVQVQLSRSNFG